MQRVNLNLSLTLSKLVATLLITFANSCNQIRPDICQAWSGPKLLMVFLKDLKKKSLIKNKFSRPQEKHAKWPSMQIVKQVICGVLHKVSATERFVAFCFATVFYKKVLCSYLELSHVKLHRSGALCLCILWTKLLLMLNRLPQEFSTTKCRIKALILCNLAWGSSLWESTYTVHQ